MAALAAAFGALLGAGIFFGLPFDPWWGWGLWASGTGILGTGLARTREVQALAIGLAVAGAVFCLAGWQVARVVTIDYAEAKKVHWLVGRVTEIVQKDDKPNRVTLRLDRVETYGLGDGDVDGASIGVYKSQIEDVIVGSDVALPVLLMAPEGPKFNGQRDGRLWRFFNGGRVAGYVVGTVEPTWRQEAVAGRFDKVLVWVEHLRQVIYARCGGLASGAVVALLTGEEKSIPPELRAAYTATGLSHLLAISGMQMTIVALGIFGLVRWLGALVPWIALRVNVRLWAALVALVGTVFYTFLAGAGVSLVRSGIMAGIVMIAVLTGRMRNALRGWCAAVVLILLMNPIMVTRAGFQLSVAAVLGLIILSIAERERWSGGKVREWARELVLATIVAGCFTAPLLVADFGQFTVIGMLANLVAVPVMSVATYLGMVALLLWPLGLEGGALSLMGLVVGWVNDWALWLNSIHVWGLGASVVVDRSLWWVVGGFSAVGAGAVFLKRWVEAGVAVASMTAVVLVIALVAPKPVTMVWDDGKIAMEKQGTGKEDAYTLLWADRKEEALRLAKVAGIKLEADGDVPQTVDDRYMPVTAYEHFAWAEKVGGRWKVEPVACGRVWQRMDDACDTE